MRLLAVETSTLAGGAALLDGDRLVGEYTLDVRTTHSERLLAAVDRLLQDAGWTPRTLEAIAVAVGPGSFTGLRIGVSTAKGLAFSLGIPVTAISTLEALAWSLPFTRHPVCPVLDARKGEVYAALFRWEGEDLIREWEDMALSPEELCRCLSGPVILVGDGISAYGGLFRERLGSSVLFAPAARRMPSAACVAELGRARLLAGETVDPVALAPRYLRPSEAELKRRAAFSVR